MDDSQVSALSSEFAPAFELIQILFDFLNKVEIILLFKTQRKWDVTAVLTIELNGSGTGIMVIKLPLLSFLGKVPKTC